MTRPAATRNDFGTVHGASCAEITRNGHPLYLFSNEALAPTSNGGAAPTGNGQRATGSRLSAARSARSSTGDHDESMS